MRNNIIYYFFLSLIFIQFNTAAVSNAQPSDHVYRFVSLRFNEVNFRAGPGVQYPVTWVFKRKGMPLKVIAEFHHWRKVTDYQGTTGWVHRSSISGKKTILFLKSKDLYRSNNANSKKKAIIEAGNVAYIKKCEADHWCKIDIADMNGWVDMTDVWGFKSLSKE